MDQPGSFLFLVYPVVLYGVARATWSLERMGLLRESGLTSLFIMVVVAIFFGWLRFRLRPGYLNLTPAGRVEQSARAVLVYLMIQLVVLVGLGATILLFTILIGMMLFGKGFK